MYAIFSHSNHRTIFDFYQHLFVLNYKIFNYIENDNTLFEKQPMNKLVEEENLMGFKHKGFWKCMDYLRDKNILDQMCNENKALWKR